MKLDEIVAHIEKQEQLPGWDAQKRMASPMRKNYTYSEVEPIARPAAVMILLYEKEGKIVFPLNKRHQYDGVHSNQIGLPGGSLDEGETEVEAALRETEEELSIMRKDVKIIRPLSQIFVPPSRFLVSPFVGWLPYAPDIKKDDVEVKEVIEMGLDQLWDEEIQKRATVQVFGMPLDVPAFSINGDIIWGATAMILSEFIALTKKQ